MTSPESYIIFRHLLSFPWYLMRQYSGICPIETNFAVDKYVRNTVHWNETISAAIIKAAHRNSKVYLLEPTFFNRLHDSLFQELHLEPVGFNFHVSDNNCQSEPSLYYRWFSNFTVNNTLNHYNRNLYAYLHTLQQRELISSGCIERVWQEAIWAEQLKN